MKSNKNDSDHDNDDYDVVDDDEYYCDLEIWLRGHSRSLPRVTSKPDFKVTIIFNVKLLD